MARPLRFYEPDRLYSISSRCHQARFFLRPDRETTQIVGGVVARALHLYPVRLYGFMAMSNHVHAIVQGSPEQIADWARYTFGEIARRINKIRCRRGSFWERRYSAQPILDNAATWEQLVYLLANPVQDHLVAQGTSWPGFSTLHEALGGEPRTFAWVDTEAFRRAKRSGKTVTKEQFTEHYPLEIAQLPDSVKLTSSHYANRLRPQLRVREEQAVQIRRKGRQRVMPIEKLLTISPFHSPEEPKRTPRPLCHTTCMRLRRVYQALYDAFRQAFSMAVDALRSGRLDVQFPPLAFRPSLPPASTSFT